MRRYLPKAVAFSLASMAVGAALAQTQPQPGPTRPPPTSLPLTKPDADVLINPTPEECRSGWHPNLSWTKEQFKSRCEHMKAIK